MGNPKGTQQAPSAIIIDALIEMSEYDLTRSVLIPLFRQLGYERVEYYGGVDEEGKDLVCWGTDELENRTVAVVQVKRYQPTRRASDQRSFSEIVTQLSQAAEKTLPTLEGDRVRPSAVYFVTPFTVDTKVLESRFEPIASLRSRNLKIVDGQVLAKLIQKKLPTLARSLAGISTDMARYIRDHLDNRALVGAVGGTRPRQAKDIYTDIDFLVARPGVTKYLASEIEAREERFWINAHLWLAGEDDERDRLEVARNDWGVRVTDIAWRTLPTKMQAAIDAARDPKTMVPRYLEVGGAFAQALASCDDEVFDGKPLVLGKSWHTATTGKGDFARLLRPLAQRHRTLVPRPLTRQLIGKVQAVIDIADHAAKGLIDHARAGVHNPDFWAYFQLYVRARSLSIQAVAQCGAPLFLQTYDECVTAISALVEPSTGTREETAAPAGLVPGLRRLLAAIDECALFHHARVADVEVRFDGTELVEFLRDRRAWLRESVAAYNEQLPAVHRLRGFITECATLFESIDTVFGGDRMSQLVLCPHRDEPRTSEFRLTVPLDRVFATASISPFSDRRAPARPRHSRCTLKRCSPPKRLTYRCSCRSPSWWPALAVAKTRTLHEPGPTPICALSSPTTYRL